MSNQQMSVEGEVNDDMMTATIIAAAVVVGLAVIGGASLLALQAFKRAKADKKCARRNRIASEPVADLYDL